MIARMADALTDAEIYELLARCRGSSLATALFGETTLQTRVAATLASVQSLRAEASRRNGLGTTGALDPEVPVPLWISCPKCGEQHVDAGEWATRVHSTHSCQFCGLTWRPAVVATVGVQFLPGFRDGK